MSTGDNESDRLRGRLKSTLKQTILLKYIVLFIILAAAIMLPGVDWPTLTFHADRIGETIRSEFIAVVAVSILITFVYDFLVRAQDEEIRKLDQNQLLDRLAVNGLLARGATELSASEAADLVEPLLENENFLQALAKRTARTDLRARNVLDSYFKPLWIEEPITHFQKWQNWLKVDPDHPNTYLWQSSQTFTTYQKPKPHRVAITDTLSVGDQLLNSGVKFNNIVVIGRDDQTLLDQLLPTFILKMKNASSLDWKNIPYKLRKFDDLFEKRQRPDHLRQLDASKLRVIEFPIESDLTENSFSFDFTVPCSLDEPFFAIEAERHCFIESISINYLGIDPLLERVWPSTFIANRSVELPDIGPDKVFEAQVNGLIMGGHGIALNWKRKAA